MSKYTAGPWRVSSSPERPACIKGANELCLAHADAEADARLIAAAPELLEAAQGLLKMFYPYGGHMDSLQLSKYTPTAQAWVLTARAAITKALGEVRTRIRRIVQDFWQDPGGAQHFGELI